MFNETLEITTGKSRRDTNWKQAKVSWTDLTKRLAKTHRTSETHAEYLSAKPERQDEIKDVGGFVGGLLTGGRRKKGSVVYRQLLTLDSDSGPTDFIEECSMWMSCTFCIYSTHKHSPEKPRYRLLIPLDRPVGADEYEAIGRRVAANLDIEWFDMTTFQAERLMYWPSTSKDAEYAYHYEPGEAMIADSVLSTYHDWHDISQWPKSVKGHDLIESRIKKQGDPLEKPGIIGSFCRTYGIADAIDQFLGDVYEKTTDGRYTYKLGSTANGVVVYDDKFSYSHHATDPTSMKLCNSFDLVRLHKFGSEDDDEIGVPVNKLPSYFKMSDLAAADKNVRQTIGEETLGAAMKDFSVDEHEMAWLKDMDVDRKSNYLTTSNNCLLILTNDPNLSGCIGYNEFTNLITVIKDLPWRKVKNKYDQNWTDTDEANLRSYFEIVYKIVHNSKIKDALNIVMEKNKFHPVRDYLNGLRWDGKERAETLFVKYMGAEDSKYVRVVTRKMLIAAVTRVFEPGCKFDNVITLIGPQGSGKSTIIGKLAGQWFSDTFSMMRDNNKAYEQIQGVWMMEIGELAGLKKAEVEDIKHFLAKREDRYRPAFGHNVVSFARQCVFIATTNNEAFLQDRTGNRRFWPITVVKKNVWDDLTQKEIDQIWAEVMTYYNDCEEIHLSSEVEELAEKTQAEHTEEYHFAGVIMNYLEKLLPENWDELDLFARRAFLDGESVLQPSGTVQRSEVCTAEIWSECLKAQVKDMTAYNTKEINQFLHSLPDWKKTGKGKRLKLYGYQKVWKRTETI